MLNFHSWGNLAGWNKAVNEQMKSTATPPSNHVLPYLKLGHKHYANIYK